MFLPSEVKCQTILLYCLKFTYACHVVFTLNNMFLHENNTFYFVTVDFYVENCECSKVPPR